MKNEVGTKIKSIRKVSNMTLKTLAEKTGFSISFLSQLERGKSSATLESLKKISIALDVNPGYFFNQTVDSEQMVRRGSLETEQMDKQNIYYESLTGFIEVPSFSPLLVTLNPDQNEGNLIQHPGQEFLYVLEGQLTVQLGEEIFTLDPHDSIMFDSSNEHYWYNYTREKVKFLCVSYDEK